MTISVLPIDSTVDRLIFVDIEGGTYGMRTYWNERDESWYLDFTDNEGTEITTGLRIGNLSWLSQYGPRLEGTVFAQSQDELNSEDPGRNDLGARVLIMYATADESI